MTDFEKSAEDLPYNVQLRRTFCPRVLEQQQRVLPGGLPKENPRLRS